MVHEFQLRPYQIRAVVLVLQVLPQRLLPELVLRQPAGAASPLKAKTSAATTRFTLLRRRY